MRRLGSLSELVKTMKLSSSAAGGFFLVSFFPLDDELFPADDAAGGGGAGAGVFLCLAILMLLLINEN